MSEKTRVNIIQFQVLESICKVIGSTNDGLTGTEINKAIVDARMKDVSPEMTKWKRLYNSCVEVQNRTNSSNNILTLIQNTYHPSRFVNNKERFEEKRSELNKVLSFIGLTLNENSKFSKIVATQTITEAQQRATSLLTKLNERNVHSEVIRFCKIELLQDNYFHAVFETTKSIADKIRVLTSLQDDGAQLFQTAFNINNPLIKINELHTETEKSEQKGFINLLIGFFGMFRNTTAHAPSITWVIEQEDAIDIMSMASMIHRRLDAAIIV